MTTSSTKDRSHESIINDTLARFLRERCGLSSVAETLHDGKRPDIIARVSGGPVILETEFEPALTVEGGRPLPPRYGVRRPEGSERFRRYGTGGAPLYKPAAPVRAHGNCDAGVGKSGASTALLAQSLPGLH